MVWRPIVLALLVAAMLVVPVLADGGKGNGKGNGKDRDKGGGDDDERGGDDDERHAPAALRRSPKLTLLQEMGEKDGKAVLRVTILNAGLATATDVQLSAFLPDDGTWSTTDKACKLAADRVDCKLGKLLPQGQRTVVVTAQAGDLDGFLAVAQAWSKA